MNILIDTNIYLDLLETSQTNAKSLDSFLRILTSKRNLKVLLPDQISDEYSRNWSNVVNKTRLIFIARNNYGPIFSPIVQDWKEVHMINKLTVKLNSYYKKIIVKFNKTFKGENGRIDEAINKIFNDAIKIPISKEIIDKAYYRMLKGNPPGKAKSYGDAIAWESILDKYTNEDLSIITRDPDWLDENDGIELNRFLNKEWSKKTKKIIKAYKTLSSFINEFEGRHPVNKKIIKEKELVTDTPMNQMGISVGNIAYMALGISPTTCMPSDTTTSAFRIDPISPISPGYFSTVYQDSILSNNLQNTSFSPSGYTSLANQNVFSKFCAHCAHANAPEAKYCSNCGKIL